MEADDGKRLALIAANRLKHWSYAVATSTFLGILALWIGLYTKNLEATLPLLGTAVLLEAQPAAAASIILGFSPLPGAILSILGNLLPLPLLWFTFRHILARWPWARHKVQRAQNWSKPYRKYGVGALVVLSPFLGAYVCLSIGTGLGYKPFPTFAAVLVGMLGSVLAIVYGGHWLTTLWNHW